MSNEKTESMQQDSALVLRIGTGTFKGTKAFIIAAVFAVIATFVYYPTNLGDYDLWWHMALGKYYLENLTLKVDHSIFSWTKADPNWIYNTCLGSLMMYLPYRIAGGFGLWLIHWMVLLALILCGYLFVRKLGEGFDIDYLNLFFITLLSLNLTAIFLKPEIFTTLFFGVSVAIYLYAKAKEYHRILFAYPPLMVLWCNLHGGFMVGLVFVTMAYFLELFTYLFIPKANKMSAKLIKTFTLILPLTYLATLINPYGISYHLSIYQNMTNELYQEYLKRLFAYLSMWKFIFPKGELPFRFVTTAWVMLFLAVFQAGVIIYLFVRQRFLDVALTVILVFFFFFSMSSGRYTLFFTAISLFSVPYLLSKMRVKPFKALSPLVSFVMIACLSVFTLYISIYYMPHAEYFGKAYNEKNNLPYETSMFLLKNNLQGPIFNDYLIGGYLLWSLYPRYKVFVDPRFGPYWQEVVPNYFKLTENFNLENFKAFREVYKFNLIVLHMREAPMIFALLQGGEWKLVFLDICSVVLVHESTVPSLSPETLATDVSPRRFRHVDNPDALNILFDFYINAGPQFGHEIMEIYQQNVSTFFKLRDAHIARMQNAIIAKENELKAKAETK